ncbi:probable RNA-binding protein 19 [Galendromus occidentalis]|uniref:Probable RNA-binding protein 19 n=1 Tax=Galendromus occidentalis TaxID=34638 RepID=A0AAJ7SFH0_9ACAR|nr:probable RNA-binding protein 19 [Galendromus occidentalis]
MSCRLFVKNFPKEATENKIRDFFSSKGTVTDVALKFTPEGKFRRFGFIGFASSNEAEEAQKYFDKTFMGTSRLHVEISKELAEKPRPWSKYSEGSTAYLKTHPEEAKQKAEQLETERKEKLEKERIRREKKDFLKEVFGDVPEEDEKFKEFLAVNQSEKLVWTNDEAKQETSAGTTHTDEGVLNDSDKKLPKEIFPHVVVVRNLSFKWKRKDLKSFFKGLSVCSIRKCLRAGVKGVAYVAFETEEDLKEALGLDKCFMERRQVRVLKHSDRTKETQEKPVSAYKDKEVAPEVVADTGRLFIRNLPYTTTENELEDLFKPFGPIAELHLSIDSITKKPKGFAFVAYVFPEHAMKAHQALDYTTFHGRLLHIIPGLAKQEDPLLSKGNKAGSSFKTEKQAKLRSQSGSAHSWNSLFLGANAVADVMAEKYSVDKMQLLGAVNGESVAVRMALGETQIVSETREFLESHGVDLSVFKQNVTERSKTILLVKNLPANTKEITLWDLFDPKKKVVRRVVLPPSGVTALVEFAEPQDARSAFKRLAYTMFMDQPLYLEWAPVNVFSRDATADEATRPSDELDTGTAGDGDDGRNEAQTQSVVDEVGGAGSEEPEEGSVLFVKNLNFSTTNDVLQRHFSKCATVVQATVATKSDPRQPGKTLSMGYGFVQFKSKQDAMMALKKLQHSTLDSHTLGLKVSRREVKAAGVERKTQKLGKASTKILVRNVPFQANRKEIFELFAVFGELKTVRLPKKMFGGDSGSHRGFAFVEFITKSDAKRAFDSLCQSTHLYGRRLVLEWAEEEEEEVDLIRKKTAEQFLGEPAKKKLKKADLKETLEGAAA